MRFALCSDVDGDKLCDTCGNAMGRSKSNSIKVWHVGEKFDSDIH